MNADRATPTVLDRMRTVLVPRSRRDRWRRTKVMRVFCAALAATAVWFVGAPFVQSTGLVPGAAGTVPVVVAVREVPVGAVVAASDVAVETRPEGQSPEQARRTVDQVIGRVASGPIGPGEVVTAYRLQGPAQLAGLPADRLAVAAPVADPALLAAVRSGDQVALLVPGTGQTVADRATVLSVVRAVGQGLAVGTEDGGHLVVALTAEQARALAAATGSATGASGFVVALRG